MGRALESITVNRDQADRPGALAGVRVVDLSTRLSGAFCAKLLGDNGADVLLLETREGHPLRCETPFLDDQPGTERSLVHAYANANKRSLLLDESDERRWALMKQADVVLVSDRATADAVLEHGNAAAIVTGVSAYGLDTPLSETPGNDLTASAATGWALVNGDEGMPPLRPILHQSDYLAGVMAYTGTVSALMAVDGGTGSGGGQVVDVCELEPMLWMAAPNILATSHGDAMKERRGTPGVFSGPVATRDGYFSVTFSRPHFWTEALKALGLDELADNSDYLNRLNRQADAAILEPTIEKALASRDRWDLFDEMSKRRCTVGVVMDMSDLASNEHLGMRGSISETVVDGRVVATLSSPCLMTETPWTLRRPAPRLGEHTDEVIAEWAVSTGAEVQR